MKSDLSKTQAQKEIDSFFQRDIFSSEEVKKIKRLAMKYKIRLKEKRKQFCKKCLSQLKGKISISKEFKTIECSSCGYKNKFKLI